MLQRLIAVLCVITGFAGHAYADTDALSPEEKIEQAAAQWSRHYEKRDLEALMQLYHEDAMLFTNGARALVGPAAIRAFFAENFKRTKGGAIDFKVEKITVFGDIAHLVSLYKMDIDVGNAAPVSAVGRSMLVYKRNAFGHWLLFADMDNQAPDATADAFADKE